MFRIDYKGNWYHEGERIKRQDLVKLFADKALVLDEDGLYWLQTPYEKYKIDVEDVPFVIVDYEINMEQGRQDIDLVTNMQEKVELGPERSFILRKEPLKSVEIPYIEVRNGLLARLSRSIYKNLVDLALNDHENAKKNGILAIKSRDMDHSLGKF